MEPLPTTPPSANPNDDVQKNKVLAAVSYLYIASLIILLIKKDSPYVQFHAKQGFVLFIASLIAGFIPLVGWLLNIVVFVAVLVGLISALQGKWYKMPGVETVAQKINF